MREQRRAKQNERKCRAQRVSAEAVQAHQARKQGYAMNRNSLIRWHEAEGAFKSQEAERQLTSKAAI
jgi:hypothetical protein